MTLEKDEGIIANLTDFEKLTVKTITPPLEDYLKCISKTGDTCYNWNIVKSLLVYKLERVLDDFMETVTENGDVSAPTPAEFQTTKDRLSGLLNGFYRAPFTVQRLLELLLEPNKHYRKFDKYARGLEKVLSVVTTVDPFPKKAPSSLLPNTVLNGNGLMRTVDDFGKKPKPLLNGEMEIIPEREDSKKRSSVSEERSPKRARVQDSTEDATIVTMTTTPETLVTMTTAPDSIAMPDSEVDMTGPSNREKTSESVSKPGEPGPTVELPPVVMVTPDSTTTEPDETGGECDTAKPFTSINHTSREGSPTDDQVSTTTSPLEESDNPASDKVETSSLSAILSDHPSDHDREG